MGIGLFLLAFSVVACESGGGGHGQSGGSSQDSIGDPETTITVSLYGNPNGAYAALGTAADVVAMTLDVKQGAAYLMVGLAMTEVSPGTWEVTPPGLPLGVPLEFIVHAYDATPAEIFTGSTTESLSGGPATISIALAPVGGGAPVTLPQITQIQRPAEIAIDSSVPVTVDVAADAGAVLDYGFASTGGVFAPDTGQITLAGTTGTIPTTYTAPSTAGVRVQTVSVTNADGNTVSSDFGMLIVDETSSTTISITFNPVIQSLTGTRVGSNVIWAAVVSDDGPQSELTYLWEFDGGLGFTDPTANPAVMEGYTTAASGTLTLTVTDDNGAGGSTSLTFQLDPGQFPDLPPDLTVAVTDVAGDEVNLTVSYTVTNSGSGPSGPFQVEVWPHRSTPVAPGVDTCAGDGFSNCIAVHASLGVGQSLSGSLTIPSSLTRGTAYAVVDSQLAVPESAEFNNVGARVWSGEFETLIFDRDNLF